MKNGQQFKSAVCSTRVIVVRKPATDDAVLYCGGVAMVDVSDPAPVDQACADPQWLQGTVMGKRYSEPGSGIQVLCVAAGDGTLTINGAKLEIEAARQLPSSD
jgi:hypothetical protein